MLHDQIAALEVSLGRGRVFLYGFKPQHRGQAHGTYRYLFNALYGYTDPPMPFELPTELHPTAAVPEHPAAPNTTGAQPSSRTGPGGETGGGVRRPGTGSANQP